ncbi:purine catabolism regulator [Cryobacterium sp. MP_M5]|uniref:PucR family transcriptional regulator n=1 Tax=unclassified Cryobacterium TaxID=2649013 RepID=UPI0018C94506|nr:MULTISPECIES: PucR family transcriptional regulator [unclassified Cryobacterium]MBG6057132.1 purine catabolism regulator [Cryobacterium sp. MP_M3]MEC5175331.1 purine catabolism regulator [Cryobacterium sp. MP_M5]
MLPASTDGLPTITLAQLLSRLAGRVMAAPATASPTLLRWVACSELADPAPFLLGGELLLTAGTPITPGDAAGIRDYVARLVAARVGALGLGLSPVHSEVPPELIHACADAALPLLVVAQGTPFVMVTRTFAEILELKRVETLKSLADTNKRLMRATMQPRPEHELLMVAAERLATWAVLVGANRQVRAQSPGAPDAPRLAPVLDRLLTGSGPRVAVDLADETGLAAVAHPVRSVDGTNLGALVVGHRPEWGAAEQSVLGSTVGLVELLARQRTAGDIAPAQLAVTLLLDSAAAPAGLADLVAHAVGLEQAAPLRVVVGVAPAGEAPMSAPDALARLLAWRGLFTTRLAALTGEGVVAITALTVTRADLAPLEEQGWVFVVGRAVAARDLPASHDEAAALRHRAVTDARSVLVEDGHRDVHAFIGREAGQVFARALLEPVMSLPPARAQLLLSVLRAWLSQNGNWDASGRLLGLHRNSVRRHVLQAGAVLDRDLDDAEVRAELLIALRYLA